jgi:hypothetical protein
LIRRVTPSPSALPAGAPTILVLHSPDALALERNGQSSLLRLLPSGRVGPVGGGWDQCRRALLFFPSTMHAMGRRFARLNACSGRPGLFANNGLGRAG